MVPCFIRGLLAFFFFFFGDYVMFFVILTVTNVIIFITMFLSCLESKLTNLKARQSWILVEHQTRVICKRIPDMLKSVQPPIKTFVVKFFFRNMILLFFPQICRRLYDRFLVNRFQNFWKWHLWRVSSIIWWTQRRSSVFVKGHTSKG